MSKFKQLMEHTLEKENLTKVRLKVDPIYASNTGISKYQGYEGYILAEHDKTTEVYITEMEMIITVPTDMIEQPKDLSKIEKFKIVALQHLKDTRELKEDDNLVTMLFRIY